MPPKGTENVSESRPALLAWMPERAYSLLRGTGFGFVGVVVGVIVGMVTINGLVERWLDERDRRVADLAESSRDAILRIDQNLIRIADQIDQLAIDSTEVRQRLARVEIQSENAANILMSARQPEIERRYFPTLAVPIEAGLGGPDLERVYGFDPMAVTIPLPRTLVDRDEAIEFLFAQHERQIRSVRSPRFDPAEHDFQIEALQLLSTDGSIELQLISYVVFKPKADVE